MWQHNTGMFCQIKHGFVAFSAQHSNEKKLNLLDTTRPEVSKLTPENTRNSQVAKPSQAESRLKHIDKHTKTMNSF